MALNGKTMYAHFWDPVPNEPFKHKCKGCNNLRTCNIKKSGYNNLKDHMISQHPGWEAILKAHVAGNGPMDAFVCQLSEKAINVFGWLDWIVDTNKPFTFCEEKKTRKYSKLKKISTKTLKKYMKLTADKVRDKMSATLPKSFGLVIDGWTINSDHYSCLFAVWTNPKSGKVEVMFLSCNVAEDITEDTVFDENLAEDEMHFGFSADDWFDIIVAALAEYEFEVDVDDIGDTVEFLCADNCSTNRALSRKTGMSLLY